MNHSRYKVFLVDDDLDDLELLTEAFKLAEHTSTVEWFTSPQKLLLDLKTISLSHIPDIIIMDHQMPLVDGSELIDYLRHDINLYKTTLAVYSTSVQENKIEELLSSGLDFFLTKGTSFDKIQEHVTMFYKAIVQKQEGLLYILPGDDAMN